MPKTPPFNLVSLAACRLKRGLSLEELGCFGETLIFFFLSLHILENLCLSVLIYDVIK